MTENLPHASEASTPAGGKRAKTEEVPPGVWNSSNKVLYHDSQERSIFMRKHPTPAEALLWEHLKNKQLGYKFRRQHSISTFIVDFYCCSNALVIEVDGGIHEGQKEFDKYREEQLTWLGCKILRFTNHEVLNDLAGVLNAIKNYCTKI